ncbi:hypothetical protein BDZ91DRAFT_714852, partial [Kalaharituber pfeilii]
MMRVTSSTPWHPFECSVRDEPGDSTFFPLMMMLLYRLTVGELGRPIGQSYPLVYPLEH